MINIRKLLWSRYRPKYPNLPQTLKINCLENIWHKDVQLVDHNQVRQWAWLLYQDWNHILVWALLNTCNEIIERFSHVEHHLFRNHFNWIIQWNLPPRSAICIVKSSKPLTIRTDTGGYSLASKPYRSTVARSEF